VLEAVFGTIVDSYAKQRTAGGGHVTGVPGSAIFVANHSSHVDTPVLLRALPRRRRSRTVVAAAADYFYTKPLLRGTVSLVFGTVPLERRARGGAAEATAHLEELIAAGWSVVFFAEGTRSRDGRVGVLRSGAAVLAARAGVPIVPVHIGGTHAAMPPGQVWMSRPAGAGWRSRHSIRVSFGEPIEVGYDDAPIDVMEAVRTFLEDCGADTTPDPRLGSPLAGQAV
jgi:1-acyl-sn-glycerol-3-phosphate acyltransferase